MNFIKPPREKDLQPDEGPRREGDERFNFLTRYHAVQLIFKVCLLRYSFISGIKGDDERLFN